MTQEQREAKVAVEAQFVDLNRFRGLGESPTYTPPVLDTDRFWPCDRWLAAPPADDGKGFGNYSWKGVRLLKDPETQVVYHDLLWDLKPATIVELGVYSGGSLLWMRDLTRSFGNATCVLHGVDMDLQRVRIPEAEMASITLHSGNLSDPEAALAFCLQDLPHPILFVDDCHCNTFEVLKFAVNRFLRQGDYVVIEDTMPLWKRYSPTMLQRHLAAFGNAMEMDLQYARLPGQTAHGIFRVK